MKKKNIIYFLILFIIGLPFVNAQELLIHNIDFADDTTTSSTYEAIGTTQNININATTDVMFIVSFTADFLDTGAGGTTAFESWRILFDSEIVVERGKKTEISDTEDDLDAILLIGIVEDVSSGIHTIDFEHKTDIDSLTTKDISFIVNTNTLGNASFLNSGNFSFSNSFSSFNLPFETLANGSFETLNNGNVISFLNYNITSATQVGHFSRLEFENQLSGVSKILVTTLGQQVLGNIDIFTGLSSGLHNFNLSARSVVSGSLTNVKGNFIFMETISDNIEISTNKTIISSGSFGTTFEEVARLSLNINNLSDIMAIATGTVFQNNSVTSVDSSVDFQFRLDNGTQGLTRTSFIRRTFGGVAQRWNNMVLTDVFEDFDTTNVDIVLFARTSIGTSFLENVTFTIIEVNDYDTNIQLFNPFPLINLVSPTNNTIVNELDFVDQDFLCNATDTFGDLANVTFSTNETGIFEVIETQLTSGSQQLITFQRIYPNDVHLIWSCEVADGENQRTTAINNFTFTALVDTLLVQPLVADTFFFDFDETTSTTFVNIASDLFILNRNSPAFISTSFEATKTTGTAARTDYFWRILLDGIDIVNLTHSLEVDETAPLQIQKTLGNLAIGMHNITLQHRVSSDTLRTSDISFAVVTSQFINGTILISQGENLSFSTTETIPTLKQEFNFTKQEDRSSIFVSVFGQASTISANADLQMFIEINGEQSGSFSQGMVDSSDNKVIAYSWLFDDLQSGINTVKIFSQNLQGSKTTSFNGDLDIVESISDDIEVNIQHEEFGLFSTASTTPVIIGNLFINISSDNSLVISSQSTISKDTAGKDNVTMFVNIENFGGSFNHTLQLEGASDIAILSFVATPPILPSGFTNISLRAFVQSGTTATFTNISFLAFEIKPLESVDLTPPNITLISPNNNTLDNIHPLNITFSVSDDSSNLIDCTLRNSTNDFSQGVFIQDTPSNLILDTGLTELSQNFPNLEIICFDNSFLNNSRTLTFNITIDTIIPILSFTSPENNSQFDKGTISSINIKGNCSDTSLFRFNITITNQTDQVASFETRTQIGNFMFLDETLNIENLGANTYTASYLCADPHTKKEISDYNVNKNTSKNSIKFVSPSLNEYEISYSTPPKNPVNVLSYGWNKESDHYNFWYRLNKTEDGSRNDFSFEVENNKFPVEYLPNSEFPAHFIMENNWLDMKLKDDPLATYLVTLNVNNNYEIEVNTNLTFLNFSSTGELNVVTLETTFNIFLFVPITDAYSRVDCPISDDLQSTLFFMFMVVLAFVIMGLGFAIRNGLVGTLGGFLLIILSVFFYACILAVGLVLTALGVFMVSFFIFKGVDNFQ